MEKDCIVCMDDFYFGFSYSVWELTLLWNHHNDFVMSCWLLGMLYYGACNVYMYWACNALWEFSGSVIWSNKKWLQSKPALLSLCKSTYKWFSCLRFQRVFWCRPFLQNDAVISVTLERYRNTPVKPGLRSKPHKWTFTSIVLKTIRKSLLRWF